MTEEEINRIMDKYIMDITLGDQDYIAPLGFEVMPEIKREEKGDPCQLIASDSKKDLTSSS